MTCVYDASKIAPPIAEDLMKTKTYKKDVSLYLVRRIERTVYYTYSVVQIKNEQLFYSEKVVLNIVY